MSKKWLTNWIRINSMKDILKTGIIASIAFLNFSITNQANATNLTQECFNLLSDAHYLEDYYFSNLNVPDVHGEYKKMAAKLALKLIRLYPHNPWGYLCFVQTKTGLNLKNERALRYLSEVRQYLKTDAEWGAYYRTVGLSIFDPPLFRRKNYYYHKAFYYDTIGNNRKGAVLDLLKIAHITVDNLSTVMGTDKLDMKPYANKMLFYYRKALALHVPSEYSRIYYDMANAYLMEEKIHEIYTIEKGDRKALYYYKKALNDFKKYGGNVLLKAEIYQHLSYIYSDIPFKNKKLAKIYQEKSDRIFQKYINLAKIYQEKNDRIFQRFINSTQSNLY